MYVHVSLSGINAHLRVLCFLEEHPRQQRSGRKVLKASINNSGILSSSPRRNAIIEGAASVIGATTRTETDKSRATFLFGQEMNCAVFSHHHLVVQIVVLCFFL